MKKYSLNNSYFKNRYWDLPSTPLACLKYKEEHWERPFACSDNTTFYDVMIERQKRNTYKTKERDQHFTPPCTARRVAEIVTEYSTGNPIIDACCWFGMLSQYIDQKVLWFDMDLDLVQAYNLLTKHSAEQENFRRYKTQADTIVSNPPYADLPEFLEWCYNSLNDGGHAILVIPAWYVDKERPKALVQMLEKFTVWYREPVNEEFAHTKIRTEIVVLSK